MADRAVFYQLTQKFVNQDRDIPEGPRQVLYYSLAIGHHVGVIDCFQSLMEIPLAAYEQWLGRLPEGAGRHKLEGLLKWGEIEINCNHSGDLIPVLKDSLPRMNADETHWTSVLVQCLQKTIEEPALYLMVRRRS